ncbi:MULTISPECIES: glycosyl hydrolase family 18 protein [unclassified Paenibacillus]|uniref:glycosyl hydrolase family 18 protein n=1 Tax=unclassified Paenibacillus TaxID=185978 RepID=UPI00020D6962|nr:MULTISPECIES: glycosyl hydrolase family 18 protein [unclassified Paenibacillus]EGL20218.1 chitinase A1 [Paenibacillus sp. HGF7]EPD82281.1 chitinase A1 [Paenibacillus sp. HGH0039]
MNLKSRQSAKTRRSHSPARVALRILLIVTLIVSLFPFLGLSAQKASAAESYKIVGYYPSWAAYGRNYNVADIDASKVTHINYAFADICWNGKHGNPDPTGPNPQTWACQDAAGANINVPNGTVVLGDPWIDTQKSFPGDTWDEPVRGNLKQLIKLKQANPNLKTIISVGGWSWSNRFSDVAASAATREVFANSAVDFIRKYQFDGVDLDWEYPVGGGLAGNSARPEDKQNYTLLLQKIREKLDAAGTADNKKYFLTIASGAGPTYAANTELGNIAKHLDWINIMTYDFNGGWQTVSAHNAPLYTDPAAIAAGVPNADTFNVEKGVQGHLDAGVPASKIVLGLAFYGRGWSGCKNTANGEYQQCAGLATTGTWEKGSFDFYDLEANYINKNGYTRYWNNTAKVPFLYNASNGTFISYDDAESIGYKTSFIKSKGLGGGMLWEFSGDRNKTLLKKVTTDLSGSAPVGDTIAPSVPANLTSTAKTSTSVTLSWSASTDNVGVTGYTVTYGTKTVDVSATTATITGLTPSTAYSFTVKAKDAAGNVSAASSAVSVTTDANSGGGTDTTAPTAPANLAVTAKTSTSVTLGWTASTDNVGVTGYTVSYGSTSVNVTGTTATISGLTAGTAYTFNVKAKDAAGNLSAAATVSATTDSGSGGAVCPAAWDTSKSYTAAQRVSYNGKIYEAKWWTQGERPDLSGQYGVWKYVSDCGAGAGSPASVSSGGAALASNLIAGAGAALPAIAPGSSAASTSSALAPSTKVLVGYWHNFDNGSGFIRLRDISPKFDVINVSFAEPVGGSTTGTIGFTPFNYTDADFKADVAYLQSQGKKVIISIGGANGQVQLTTAGARSNFVSSMKSIISKYGFDGLDIDFEGHSLYLNPGDADFKNPTTPVITNLISAIRELHDSFGDKFMLTMAPETFFVQLGYSFYGGTCSGCDTRAGAYLPVIYGVRDILDWLQVQLYNSGPITGLDDQYHTMGVADFHVAMTDMLLTGFPIAKNPNSFFPALRPDQVVVGLPANGNAGGGFTSVSEVHKALDYLMKGKAFGSYTLRGSVQPGLRGLMTWSINWDKFNNFEFSNSHRAYLDSFGPGTPVDTQAPSVPGNLRSSNVTATGVTLTWNASTDNTGVTGYEVYQGSVKIADTASTTYNVSNLTANTSYTFIVKAKDAAGNVSAASTPLAVTTANGGGSGDTSAPTAPTALKVTAKSSSSVSLSWTASTDNVGVTGYTVSYGTNAVDVTGTTAVITGLTANTAYTFTVKAKDAAGNVSAAASIQATTDPAAPGGPAAWAAGVSYKVNEEVTYNGSTYICRQPHTSLQGWEPSNVPALWTKK